jgi:hypothetical protein
MAKVRILDGDDWMKLFVDGEEVESGHHIRISDLLSALGIDYEIVFGEWDENDEYRFKATSVLSNDKSIDGTALARITAEVRDIKA